MALTYHDATRRDILHSHGGSGVRSLRWRALLQSACRHRQEPRRSSALAAALARKGGPPDAFRVPRFGETLLFAAPRS